MTSDNERKLCDAEAYLGIASGLLQEVIDSEWRDMDDSDCETEAMIDNLESICEAVRKQQSQLFSINIGISTEAIRRSFPNTLALLGTRMPSCDHAIVPRDARRIWCCPASTRSSIDHVQASLFSHVVERFCPVTGASLIGNAPDCSHRLNTAVSCSRHTHRCLFQKRFCR